MGATLVPGTADAGERRAAFIVGASIVNGCTVASDVSGSWGDIAMGTVPGIPGASASGSLSAGGVAGLSIECTPGADVSLAIDQGLNSQSGTRRLAPASGASRLDYRLFVDGSATPWTTQSLRLAFPAGGQRRVLPIRAETSLPTTLPAGRYTDTIRLTLSF
nr:spore coat U domain-containing protein [Sphingomonas jejuensis]